MAWMKELRKIKTEQHDTGAEDQRTAGLKQRRADYAIRKLNPTVTKHLEGVGMAQWGKGWSGRRYELRSPPRAYVSQYGAVVPAVWSIVHKDRGNVHHSFTVQLSFHQDGKPAYMDIKGRENRRIKAFSVAAFRDALRAVFESGPREEYMNGHSGFLWDQQVYAR